MADELESSGDELYTLLASNDHKSIGRLWIALSLLFLLDFAILGVVTGIERTGLDGFSIFDSATGFQQAWALVRTAGVFMVALPLLIGIATAIVPLQVGSPSIAFPRLAAAAFWTWLFGAGIHLASFVADGGFGPAAGTRTESTLLSITSLGMMLIALVAASICIATTIIALRPAGMTLLRVPMFSWSMLVVTSVWILSLPVLAANLIYAWVDLQGRDPIFFGNPDRIWGDIEWAFQQPQIMSLAIPVIGILGEVVPVAAKVRQANRQILMAMIGLMGALTFGAWAQNPFSRGGDPAFPNGNFIYEEFLYIAFAIALLLPILGSLGGAADTIRRGSMPKMSPALLGAMAGAVLVLAAGLVGAIRVLPFAEVLFDEDRNGVHHMLSSAGAQYTLVIAAVIASSIGAMVYWSPKLFGGYAADGLASIGILAALAGGLIAGITDLVSAFLGQRDISIDSGVDDSIGALNGVGLIGMALLALAGAAAILSAIKASRSDEVLPDDPWEGHTLEWATPSPPPSGNFVEPIDVLQSEAPLLDEFEEAN